MMTTTDQIKDEKLQMISIEKQQKYLLYHQENFINISILLVKIYYHPPIHPITNNRANKIYLFFFRKSF